MVTASVGRFSVLRCAVRRSGESSETADATPVYLFAKEHAEGGAENVLFVAGLPREVTAAALRAAVETFGEVAELRVAAVPRAF